MKRWGAGGRREPGACEEKGDGKKCEDDWVQGVGGGGKQRGTGAAVTRPRVTRSRAAAEERRKVWKGRPGARSGKAWRPREALCQRGAGC